MAVEVEGLVERLDDGVVNDRTAGHIPRWLATTRVDLGQCEPSVVGLLGHDDGYFHGFAELVDGRLDLKHFSLEHLLYMPSEVPSRKMIMLSGRQQLAV